MKIQLEPTGERVIPEHHRDTPQKYLLHLFHLATYRFAAKYTAGGHVLDYGCGSGYGSKLIAESAISVVAVDVAQDAVRYAASHYSSENLSFSHIDPERPLPFEAGRFDTVLSFQVIEHVPDPDSYLAEAARVLKPGGRLVIATPDRRTRLFPLQRPWNRWHLKEYDDRGLRALLLRTFPKVDLYFMGGRPKALELELNRTRRIKWLSVPMTLPFLPDRLRVASLAAIQARGLRRRKAAPPRPQPESFGLEESDIEIGPNIWPSVNLIAVAQRS